MLEKSEAEGFRGTALGAEGVGLRLGNSGAVGSTGNGGTLSIRAAGSLSGGNGLMVGNELSRIGGRVSGGSGLMVGNELRDGNGSWATGGFIIGTPFVPFSEAPTKLLLSKLALVR